MALNPPSGIVKWFNTPLGERGWNSFRAQLTGKDYPGTSRKTSYVKLSDKEAEEVISNIKKDPEGIPLFDEANAPDKAEEYQRWLVARYLTKSREEGFEDRKKEGTKQLEEELGPEGLDELLNLIREESKVEVGAGVGGGGGSSSEPPPSPPQPQSSSALAVVPKKEDDLVEEEIDSQILSILGLEDVFDLTYEEYYRELRTAAAAGRMPGSQMSTESIELITEELKRVKGKTGRFKVKQKKIDINKVLDRKQPTPPGAIVKAQKLIPTAPEVEPEQPEKKTVVTPENLQDDLLNGIGNILESLITIRTLMQNQSKGEQKIAEEEAKKTNKQKKKERESALEKKKPQSPIVKAVAKPVIGFFDAIKKFFTNVVLGSVVLGLFKWLNDPNNKESIDKFTNFLENNAGLILGGLLAIAAIPLVSTILGFLTPITAIAIPAITAAFGFLASPAGLAALAVLAGLGAAGLAVKGVETVGKKLLYGGGDLPEAQVALNKKLIAAGMDTRGNAKTGNSRQRARGGGGTKPRTPEQEKIFQEVEAERARLKDIRKRMDAEIKAEMDKVEPTGREVRGGRQFTAEDQRRREEAKERVIQKYNKEINLDKGETVPTSTSTSTPKPKPKTPLMPGPSPSAAQPKTESAGNRDGSGVVKGDEVIMQKDQKAVGSTGVTKEGTAFNLGDINALKQEQEKFITQNNYSNDVRDRLIKPYDELLGELRRKKQIEKDIENINRNIASMPQQEWRWKPELEKKQKELVESSKKTTELFGKLGITDANLKQSQMRRGGREKDDSYVDPSKTQPSAVQNLVANTQRLFGVSPKTTSTTTGNAGNQVGSTTTVVKPTITGRYGEQRTGYAHGGTDLAVDKGTPLTAVSDGEIVDYGDLNQSGAKRGDPGGWGNFLVYKDTQGIYHLYGHIQDGFKKSGKVKRGEQIAKVGMTGRTSGPHLHWEAGTAWNGGALSGKFDPLNRYSSTAPFSLDPSAAVQTQPQQLAQVAQTAPPTPSIPSPTGRGNIVPLPIPTGGGAQQASSGTASNQAPVPSFSSIDPNNATTMVVRAIYNIIG